MQKDEAYNTLTAKRTQFKTFCRLNEHDLRTFLHLNYLAVRYFTLKWVDLLSENSVECYKKVRFNTGEQKPNVLPNFAAIANSAIRQVDKVLSRPLYTLEDLDSEFSN